MDQFKYPLVPVSKYILLSSTSSHEYFPGNQGNDFSNKLIEPIRSNFNSNLEIGLVELYYTPVPPVHKKTIFGHETRDNIISIAQRFESAIYRTKEAVRIAVFVESLNRELAKFRPEVKFKYFGDGHTLRLIIVNDFKGFRVELTTEYARAFGFSKFVFKNGETLAEHPFNQSIYDSIDVTLQIKMSFIKDVQKDVTVNEPSEMDVSYLISEMNKAVSQFDISFLYDGNYFE